jgi:hypothetical protein
MKVNVRGCTIIDCLVIIRFVGKAHFQNGIFSALVEQSAYSYTILSFTCFPRRNCMSEIYW